MNLDRARREMDSVPRLPMRKRSLEVDDILLSEHHLIDPSCCNFRDNGISIIEDSRESVEWDFSCQGFTKVSPLIDSQKMLELCSKSSIASSGTHSRMLRGMKKADFLASEKSNPSLNNRSRPKVSSAGSGKTPSIAVRRRPQTNGHHRTLDVSSDHCRYINLSDRLPTIEEFQRGNFEEDQVRVHGCGSELQGRRSRSCGDVRRRGRKPSLRQNKESLSHCNEYVDLKGFKSQDTALSRFTRKISEQTRRIENAILDQSIFRFDDSDPARVSPKASPESAQGLLVSLESTPMATRANSSYSNSSYHHSISPLNPTLRSSRMTRHLSNECQALEQFYDEDDTRPSSTRGVFDEPTKLSKSRSLPKMPTRKHSTDPTSKLANASWRN
jgi:hypothetical protein